MVRADFGDIDVDKKVPCFRIRVTAFTKVKLTLKMKTLNTKEQMEIARFADDKLDK